MPARLVRTERLVEDLWGEIAVSTQRNTLQSKVSQLRKALGDTALVVGTSDGYRLDVDPVSIDVHTVLDDAVAAEQSLEAGDLERAATCAGAGLARFGGEPFPAAGDWAIPHRVRLSATRLAVCSRRSSRLANGRETRACSPTSKPRSRRTPTKSGSGR